MKNSVLAAFICFGFCFFIQCVIWRIFKPKHYLFVIPAIFFGIPIAFCLFSYLSPCGYFLTSDRDFLVYAGILYSLIVACFTGGFAGIVEYSPSAEILRAVSKYPEGIAPSLLEVNSLGESALTGKRIRHLLLNNLIAIDGERMVLTSRGRRSVWVCELYRLIFGIKQSAQG